MERQAKDGTVYQMVGEDQWSPVTRSAKDGTVYKKIGSDEWAPLESAKPTEGPPQVSQERGVIDTLRDGLDVTNWPKNAMAGLQKIDEYTGAPVRKFVTEAITGKDLEKAPTGAEQAKMMGATDKTYGEVYGVPTYMGGNISPADVYGVGLEAIQDPLLLAGKAAQGARRVFTGGAALAEEFGARQATRAAQSQAASASAESAAKSRAAISGGDVSLEQSGKFFDYKAPKSLKELEQWKPEVGAGELLGKERLKEIESAVPDLRTKPLKYYYDMMENPKAMKELKLKFENLPTEDAKKIAAYNLEIVEESARKINQTVEGISGFEPKSMTDAGYDLISSVKEKYNAEKKALGPVFDELKKTPRSTRDETMDLARAIGENTKLGKVMEVGEDGKLLLRKNSPRTGISDQEHSILSRVIDDMNDGMTFKEMQDTRSFLRKAIDPMNPGATAEINKVRSILLDQMESKAAKHGPGVGDTFKAYAVNERARENVEKVIGGKIQSLDAMYAANPDKVLQKIFSNPNYAKVVGDYVGPEKMQEMVAAFVSNGVKKSFDSTKGFAPSTLKTWLKSNSTFLKANVKPEVVQRLNALADYGYYGKRFLDEVNPSGTAASLKEMINPGGFVNSFRQKGLTGAVESAVANTVHAGTKQRQAVKTVNEMLGTVEPSIGSKIAKRVSGIPDISEGIDRATRFQQGSATARGTIRDVTPLRSAEKDKNDPPKKGFEKWADDGFQKLQKHDKDGLDSAAIEKIKKSKEGRDLLIHASRLTPGSKAMDKVLLKIKTSYLNGGQ